MPPPAAAGHPPQKTTKRFSIVARSPRQPSSRLERSLCVEGFAEITTRKPCRSRRTSQEHTFYALSRAWLGRLPGSCPESRPRV